MRLSRSPASTIALWAVSRTMTRAASSGETSPAATASRSAADAPTASAADLTGGTGSPRPADAVEKSPEPYLSATQRITRLAQGGGRLPCERGGAAWGTRTHDPIITKAAVAPRKSRTYHRVSSSGATSDTRFPSSTQTQRGAHSTTLAAKVASVQPRHELRPPPDPLPSVWNGWKADIRLPTSTVVKFSLPVCYKCRM